MHIKVPGAGHGLNLEYTHPNTYASILDYFVQHGLGSEGSSSSAPSGKPNQGHPHGGSWKKYHGPPA